MRCWGLNNSGRLGVSSTAAFGTFVGDAAGELASFGNVELGTGAVATSIACGAEHTCARLADGRFKCWGKNTDGALGLDSQAAAYGDQPGELGDALPALALP